MNALAEQVKNPIEFETLAKDAPVMLWLTNTEGEIIFSNTRWKEFVGAEKVAKQGGVAWYEALHPEDRERSVTTFKKAFATRRSFEMKYRMKRIDGEYRHMLDTGEPYISADGSFSGYIGSSSDITEQIHSEEQIKKSHNEMELHNKEMRLINKLNSFLQICRNLEETYPIVLLYAREMFPDCTGSVYLLNEKKTVIESVVQWGPQADSLLPISTPDDCWSLRQGKPHVVIDIKNSLFCSHFESVPEHGCMCVPIIAQGDMVGMIHLQFPKLSGNPGIVEMGRSLGSTRRLVYMTADNLALAIVSLKLRDALKTQSIKDPLTKLYNRRYMEESLDREFARCKRIDKPLGVLMLDIDYFKAYNDNYGHDCGDKILSEIGNLLAKLSRTSDITCRYGGEEFILILPDAPLHILEQRAEEIRADINNLHISFKGENHDEIGVSIGVAMYPSHANTTDSLVKAADNALYEAKQTGRNKVVVANNIRIPGSESMSIENKVSTVRKVASK